jgi:hypothetical protein
MALSDVLSQIPGYAGYTAARARNQQQEQGELQQALTLQGVLAKIQAQEKDAAFRRDLSALGDAPTQEQLAQVSARYSSPEKVMESQQRSLDRAETVKAQKEAHANALEQRKATLDLQRESFLQRTADANARMAFEQDYKRQRLALDQKLMELRRDMPRQNPVVTTDSGIFERGPNGLVPLIDPNTGEQARPKVGERPITEFQGKNALYGSRAQQADKILLGLEEKISQTGLAMKQAVQGAPIIGGPLGAAGNVLLSSNQQAVEQAQRNFVNAVLRQESGAVISDPEFENAKKQYFPQPGDKPQVLANKRANRKLAIQGFKKIAGPAWTDVEAADRAVPAPAPAPAASPSGWSIRPK